MFILSFDDSRAIDRTLTGGKGASLASMKQAGFSVPDGFVILQSAFEDGCLTEQAKNEIVSALAGFTESELFAVRSSAVAEDGAAASFAGMFESLLDVSKESILSAIAEVYASSQSERVREYAKTQGLEEIGGVAVVVQQMIAADFAGVLFTADPQTSDRFTTVIEAVEGLGEALVSGRKTPATWRIRHDKITGENRMLEPATLSKLASLGKNIEKHYRAPQDIEWCLKGNELYIVQSRPITTLFPLPDVGDGKNRVYMSFGHQQMMTDAMKPFGISFFERGFMDKPKKGQDAEYFVPIGGRLFLDLSRDLSIPIWRNAMIAAMGAIDPLVCSSLTQLAKRKGFTDSLARSGKGFMSMMSASYFSFALVVQVIKLNGSNDKSVMDRVISKSDAAILALEKQLAAMSGEELLTAGFKKFSDALRVSMNDPESMGAVFAGTLSAGWLDKHIERWLGEKGASNLLSRSVGNNITTNMGLDLMDVADTIRKYPQVIEYLPHAKNETFFAGLKELPGGDVVSKAIQSYLQKYGMRCPGEIDITRPRFIEQPTLLVPILLSNIKNFPPNARAELTQQGLREAQQKEQDILSRLEKLSGGKNKAKKTSKKISMLRGFIGWREYPKYIMIRYYWVIKMALRREADRLVQLGVIHDPEDIYYLSLEELLEAVRSGRVDAAVIAKRRTEFASYQKLTVPRVMTSEGEIITGEYSSKSIPKGALAGIAVSSGVIEGRARVVLTLDTAHIEKGDILVTTFTDPSWTPVFVTIKGLVAEVGGVMTHGSVVAREYGLPAVVGVAGATGYIKDGDIIRVDGDKGYVEILERKGVR